MFNWFFKSLRNFNPKFRRSIAMNEQYPENNKNHQATNQETRNIDFEDNSSDPKLENTYYDCKQNDSNSDACEHLEKEYQGTNEIEIFKSERLEEINRDTKKLIKSVEKIAKEKDRLIRELKANNEILAKCQQTTSEIANRNLERFALEPAIEVVDLLCNFIEEIASDEAFNTENICPLLYKLKQIVRQAENIAHEKREYLGLVKIQPEKMDDLDPQRHQIKGAVDTTDKEKHKKIERTLTAGLMYKDKILKQARVSVYRFKG
jgi:molecular chaperone GrpE (heat shock protein)